MKVQIRRRIAIAASLVSLCGLAASACGLAAFADTAHHGPHVVVTLTGTIKRGDNTVPVDQAGLVKPGEVVHWTIDAHNDGSANAENYNVSGRVPSRTALVVGSPGGDFTPQVAYSIDGGKEYSMQPTLRHDLGNGKVTTTPASPAVYTNVRFTWSTPIPAGGKRHAVYDVRVK